MATMGILPADGGSVMLFEDIRNFLISEGVRCACIEMLDGRIIEIDCKARCRDDRET